MPRHRRKIINPTYHERARMYDYVTSKQGGRNTTTPRKVERDALDNAAYGDVGSLQPSQDEIIEALVDEGKYQYCNSCLKAYPATAQFFRRSHITRSGITSLCVECNRDLSRRNMARLRARRMAEKYGK